MGNISTSKTKKIAVCTKKLPPCNAICPAGEDIQQWLSLTKVKKFREAWEVIMQDNPLPAIHGRVCSHQCETRCNRIHYDAAVGIHCIERFLGDMALAEGWPVPISSKEITGKKVLVVGAGPAGLSAAYHLRLLGHEVTIYEALPAAGGTMLVGIPVYRLPRKILTAEIARVVNLGIKIEYNRKVADLLFEKEQGDFDAVFLAVGVHLGKDVVFPMEQPCLVMDAVDYLREVAFERPPAIGSRLVIYGGGNAAIDVARSAKRLGVAEITVIYHRTRQKMSAYPCEIESALEEGIKFIFLRSIIKLVNNTLTLSINELDDRGGAKQTGIIETLETDALIFALSQVPDSEFLSKVPDIELQPNGIITVDSFFMTGCQGVFAGGDMILYDRSVTIAVGHGKQAARHINAYLNDAVLQTSSPYQLEFIGFDKLHVADEKSVRIAHEMVAVDTRLKSFAEIEQTCSKNEVLYEARRCFSCGNCFGCGKCYTTCPVKAIAHSELTKKVSSIDAEKCIGCGKCFKVCPSGAIVMLDSKK